MTNPVEYLIANYEASNYSFVSEDTVKFKTDLDAALTYIREKTLQYHGLKQEKTLKDYFAGKAMQSIITDGKLGKLLIHDDYMKKVAEMSYEYADAMMKAKQNV